MVKKVQEVEEYLQHSTPSYFFTIKDFQTQVTKTMMYLFFYENFVSVLLKACWNKNSKKIPIPLFNKITYLGM